jgi:hypothetical protein
MVSLSWPLDYQLFTSLNRTLTVFAGRDFPRGAFIFSIATHPLCLPSGLREVVLPRDCCNLLAVISWHYLQFRFYLSKYQWPTGNHVCLCSGEISGPREPIKVELRTLNEAS